MSESLMERVVRLARADDPACAEALASLVAPELLGELLVAVYRAGTPAARAALVPLLQEPFQRGRWQGAKRIYKLAEAGRDAETWARIALTLEHKQWGSWPVSPRTLGYLQRRSYRHLKALAQTDPGAFWVHLELVLPGAERVTPLVARLLRLELLDFEPAPSGGFQAALENPFAAVEEGEAFADALALLDLDAAALSAAAVEPPPAAPPARARRPWPGPIFPEVWAADPARLLALLERVTLEAPAAALARLLRERVGERLLEQPLDAFYGLLHHPVAAVWRLGLFELAARARRELLRFDELVPLFERAARSGPGDGPDWAVLADLLYVLDDERAEAARAGLGDPLIALLRAHGDASEVGPVVAFLRGHFAARLGPPLFDAAAALDLLRARRPDVRGLGRDALERVCAAGPLGPGQVAKLLRAPACAEDPAFVEGLLCASAGQPGGYRPPCAALGLDETAALARDLPQAGFELLRKVLLRFEEDEQGLDPQAADRLVAADDRRARGLGLELYGGALRRGRRGLLNVVALLRAGHEDVVVWARERIEEAAAAGRLPNEALYRMLDAAAADLRGFGRELVAGHLQRFQVAELIVFCAESPDAATADLGIRLYRQELHGQEHYDLARLLPMFRILLYKVAAARQEKERLYGLLREWSLEAADQARLTVEVVAAFRRSTCRLDLTRALTLLVAIERRFGAEVPLPFAVHEVFGATLAASGAGGAP
ncbi:MAG: hypothetical protein AB7N76_21490 [Planctomycetota bacterium]